MITIQQPETLCIQGTVSAAWGANQMWYGSTWQRRAGCGPTTCSNLIWYLAKTQDHLRQLWPHEGNHKANMLRLMEELWLYVTPGKMGVNNTEIFADGATRFGTDKGIPLSPQVLDIPVLPHKRPGHAKVEEFLHSAFSEDLPVAFLNLNNGGLRNLESWHWVTLVSLNEDRWTACMMDQGQKVEIDLDLWLRKTKMGGGFVALQAA